MVGRVLIRNRIKELRMVEANTLIPSPRNYRRHPPEQRKAFKAVLNELGFAGGVLVRELPDGRFEVCDGHLRSELLGQQKIPVLVTDLTPMPPAHGLRFNHGDCGGLSGGEK